MTDDGNKGSIFQWIFIDDGGSQTWWQTALESSERAAPSHKYAHAAQSPDKWETGSGRAGVPADDECLSPLMTGGMQRE